MNNIYEIIKEDLKNNKFPDNLDKKDLKNLFHYAKENRLVTRMAAKINNQDFYKIIPEIPLKKYQISSKSRYLELVNEIFYINKLLKENNIEPIFLKGACFYLLDIHNPEDRFMADIDILIKKDLLEKAVKILLNNDYAFKRFDNFNELKINDSWTHQTPVIISPNGYAIDIHHRATSPRKLKGECVLTKEIFDNPEYIDKYNSLFAIPRPEHCIYHLSYNSTNHDMFSSGPSIFYDIRDLIIYIKKNKKIEEVNKFIKSFQDTKSTNITLAMSEEMGVDIPFKYNKPPRKIIDLSLQMIFMGSKISLLNRKYSINKFNYRLKNSVQSKYLKSNSRLENSYRLAKVLIFKISDFIKYLIFLIFKPSIYKNYKIIKKYTSS